MEGTKFRTYQNPAVSAALTANSLRPTKSTFLTIFSLSTLSAFLLLTIFSREDGFIDNLRHIKHVSQTAAYLVAKIIQILVGLVFLGTVFAFVRAFLLQRASGGGSSSSLTSGNKEQKHLSDRQLGLVGIKPKAVEKLEPEYESPAMKPPKSRMPYSAGWSSPSSALFPLHRNNGPSPNSPYKASSTVGGSNKMSSRYTPSSSKSPGSPSSLYLVSSPSLLGSLVKTSPGLERNVSSPWSKQRTPPRKDIANEEMLEQFLVDVDEKISELAEKQTTPPPPALGGFGIASPSTVVNTANTSGTTRSTPLRPVRMSPSSQKFSTPPKKGEGDLPPPMSMEESIEAFENLGIYPDIEEWRDRLRQWFSLVLLNPLIDKIETTHSQVNHAASRLGYTISISQVGSDSTSSTIPSTVSPIDGTKEWQPAFAMDEDGHLHQLRAKLVQALDAPATNLPSTNLLQPEQKNLLQECVDAITEHQRLHALMKGEWAKGLLPQSSVRTDYTVQRIRELAEGTCLKNYEYMGSGEVYDKVNKKWTLELPTDSHLLLYLFCAFLEHPKWMLHVDPTLYASAQSSKNPLFLGVLPPKERFPEKYVAVISGVPPVLHPGACILVVGKQSPPPFALYWDKKLQFSLQGRTALWDAILLLCHRIKLDYGGVVRGMHLSSAACNILPVIESEAEN